MKTLTVGLEKCKKKTKVLNHFTEITWFHVILFIISRCEIIWLYDYIMWLYDFPLQFICKILIFLSSRDSCQVNVSFLCSLKKLKNFIPFSGDVEGNIDVKSINFIDGLWMLIPAGKRCLWEISVSESDLYWVRHFRDLLETFQKRWLFCNVFKTSQIHLKKDVFFVTSLIRLKTSQKRCLFRDVSETSQKHLSQVFLVFQK